MAIAFDALSNAGSPGAVSSYSWSHTVTGTNTFLWVRLVQATAVQGTYVHATAVDWGGAAMTLSDRIDVDFPGLGDGVTFEIWYLKAAGSGTNNINVTLASAPANGTGAVAQSYTGVDQTNPVDSHVNGSSISTTVFAAPTTVVATNCWLVGFVWFDSSGTVSTNNAQTTARQIDTVQATGDSNGVVGTGSQALSWTDNVNTTVAGATMSIAPFVSGPQFTLMPQICL